MHRADAAGRQARLQHRVVRRAPLPRGPLALPGARGRHRRAHPGHQEHPARLRRHAAAVRVHAPGPRRREGRDRRRPLAAAASSGAPAARRRWSRPRSTSTAQASRDEWEEAIEIIVAMWQRRVLRVGQPRRSSSPSAWSRRSRSRTRTRRRGWRRRRDGSSRGRRANQLGLLSFSIMQPLEKMAEQIKRLPRGVEQPRRQADHRRRHQQGRGVHARALRRDQAAGRSTTASGSRSAWWYQNIAQFTLDWELPHLVRRRSRTRRSRC